MRGLPTCSFAFFFGKPATMIQRRLPIASASLLGLAAALSACASGNDLPSADTAASQVTTIGVTG